MFSQSYAGRAFFFFWLLLVGPLVLNGCDNPTPSDTRAIDTRPAGTATPPEQNLATIDAGTQTPANDPIVVKYKVLLDDLSETYSATRQQIADQTAKAWDILRAKGADETTLAIMSGMDKLFGLRRHNQSYHQMLAAYITMREVGISRKDALHTLKTLAHASEAE